MTWEKAMICCIKLFLFIKLSLVGHKFTVVMVDRTTVVKDQIGMI